LAKDKEGGKEQIAKQSVTKKKPAEHKKIDVSGEKLAHVAGEPARTNNSR
jgi:hypothetical protein